MRPRNLLVNGNCLELSIQSACRIGPEPTEAKAMDVVDES